MEYNCEKCKLCFKYKSKYEEHLGSKKHKGEPRKERSDKTYNSKCQVCRFEFNNHTNMKVHMLTKHGTPEERKEHFKYYCEHCDFGTFAEVLYTRHLETKKHLEVSVKSLNI
jgi:hypothetical protein